MKIKMISKEEESKIIKEKQKEDKGKKKKTERIPKLKRIKNFKKKIKARILDKFRPSRTLLIEMLHTNGTLSHFVIASQVHKFSYSDRVYVIDEERKIFCNSTKLYMLRYHEGFALPFEIDISAIQLKKAIDTSQEELKEITTSFNPYVLKDVLKFEYTKGVIQGAEVHEFIKRSFILSIIILAAVLIMFAVMVYKMGWI